MSGGRVTHYTGAHVESTLVTFLDQSTVPSLMSRSTGGSSETGSAATAVGVLRAIAAFRAAVDRALPGMYHWFPDSALHITIRALAVPVGIGTSQCLRVERVNRHDSSSVLVSSNAC
jgi:hypothetical protein